MPIDLARMQRRLDALTTPELGGTPAGGMSRLALTDTDRAARDLFVAWLREEGLEPRVDDFGNIYGRRAGSDPDLAPVLVGSHLDTVPGGGRFDGILGVVAALEVASALNGAGVATRRPIDVVNWTNEEGARFTPAMLASGGMIGVFAKEWVYARTDRQGLAFGEELARIGYLGEEAARPRRVAANLELHIEQGPILEAGGESVGIVEGVVGIRWCRVTVRGQSAHAGPTPMASRRDAMVAAARMVVAARDLARERGDHNATVGTLTPEPGVVNVIPPVVTFSLDLRGRDDATLDGLIATDLRARFDAIAGEERVEYDLAVEWGVPPTPFDAAIKDRAEALCRERGYRARRLWAGAGHDSQYLARVAPTAMLFTPTIGGLSHCETEDAPWPDIERAADILLALATELANR
jgi:beta-ureidopropionase / N-carbamoyl-L-amino-acid hydrolase